MLLFLALIVGCSITAPVTSGDIPRFSTPFGAAIWVYRMVEYTPDVRGDFWQYPAETLALMTGDCEDKALLAMWIINDQFSIKPDMYIVKATGYSLHACVVIDGAVLVESLRPNSTIIVRWTYDQAMTLIPFCRLGEAN